MDPRRRGLGSGWAIAGYFVWVRSPQYSIGRIKHAVESHDLVLFRKHVDLDGVSSRMVDDLLGSFEDESSKSGGSGFEGVAYGLIRLMKPRLVETMRDQMARVVETGQLENPKGADADSTGPSLRGLARNLGAEGDRLRGISYVRHNGKIALVGLGFRHVRLDTTMVLELKMRDMGGYWQLAELSNLKTLLASVHDAEAAQLTRLNAPARAAIDAAVAASSPSLQGRSDSWGISKYVDLGFWIYNTSTKGITRVESTVTITDVNGAVVRKVRISSDQPVAPGAKRFATWSFDVNMFDSADQRLYDLTSGGWLMDAAFNRVVFEDGSELKTFGSLDEAMQIAQSK